MRIVCWHAHEISYLIFSKSRKDVAKFVVCYSCDWRFKLNKCMLTPKLMGAATKLLNRSRGYKTFSMLNSAEHEVYPAHKC